MPFRELGLGPALLRAIQEAGYTEPTPIQQKAIPVVLKGHDAIGIAQTGTGKTAAFVLPILQRLGGPPAKKGTRVLVLVPTRELAVQVEENVRQYAKHMPLRCAPVFGGVNENPQIKALQARVDIIVATPGRLIDLMTRFGNPFQNLEVLVLDEADRMLDMGFLPDMKRILKQLPAKRQTLLFSATLSDSIEKVTREFLTHPETVQVGRRSTPTHTVAQFVYEVPRSKKVPLLLHLLKDEGLDCVLVFTRTKRGADKLAKRLLQERIPTSSLHSNRSQSQRQAALRGFKSGEFRVLVATDIAARGIDVDGISHVVNYDFPAAPEDYVHRIGRTGRAQAIGDALSFVTSEDHEALRELERFIGRGVPRRTVEGLKAEEAPPRGAEPERAQGGRPGGRGGDGGRQGSRGGRGEAVRSGTPRGQGGGRGQGGATQGGGRGSSGGQGQPRRGGAGSGQGQGQPSRGGAPRGQGGGRQERRREEPGRAAGQSRPREERGRGETSPSRGSEGRSDIGRVTLLWDKSGKPIYGRRPKPGR